MADPMLHGIVRIAGGAGFIVSQDGLVATCAHVVKGLQIGDRMQIAFHATGQAGVARVKILREAEDVAILHLEAPLPEEVKPLQLGGSKTAKDRVFDTFGFPDAKPIEGMPGRCDVIGETTQDGFPVLQLRSGEITSGYSGAPMWDASLRVVIGVVTSVAVQDALGKQQDTAFVIPAETLRDVCPDLHIKDICPYRGLAAFTEKDADFFFGREKLVETLVTHLREYPGFLAVVGPSGSGKSSVVQAGLIPALRRGALSGSQEWRITILRPGSDPYANPEWQVLNGDNAPADTSDHRLVVVIDQFEELFALCPPEVQDQFLTDLHTLITGPVPITFLLTLRSNFYGHLQQSLLGEQLPEHQVNVDRIAPDDLHTVVEKPAERVGLRFEAGLVETIVQEAQRADHTLPLLQSVLTQLWEQQESGWLTYASYKRVGRVAGALGLWADDTYRSLGQQEQILAQRIFTRLVHYGEEARGDTRQRVQLCDLAPGQDALDKLPELVRRLADARLLVTDGDGETETAEIIHDALLREWGQLREWINAQREFRLWQQRLEDRRGVWEEKERDEGALLRGALLAEAERWIQEEPHELTEAAATYIQASVEQRTQEEAAQETQRRQLVELLEERELTNLQLRAANEELARTQDLRLMAVLGQVTAGLIHKMGNALGPIPHYWTKQIEDSLGPSDEVAHRALRRIRDNAADALTYVEGMNTLLASQKIRREETHLESLLGDALENIIANVEKDKIVVDSNLDEVAVPVIYISPSLINEVFQNITRNAIQAMPDGGRLRIHLEQIDEKNLRIAISDTGLGIPESKQKNIFTPGFSTKRDGMGLGLWFSKAVVEQHHGTIQFVSQEGVGTTFTIVLPIQDSSTT